MSWKWNKLNLKGFSFVDETTYKIRTFGKNSANSKRKNCYVILPGFHIFTLKYDWSLTGIEMNVGYRQFDKAISNRNIYDAFEDPHIVCRLEIRDRKHQSWETIERIVFETAFSQIINPATGLLRYELIHKHEKGRPKDVTRRNQEMPG